MPPRYFAVMKRVNRDGTVPASPAKPRQLGVEDLEDLLRDKAIVIDTRTADKFAAAHIPGTLNIPLGKSFLNWTGALVPEDRDVYLVIEGGGDEAALVADLAKIGLTRVAGFFRSDVVAGWKSRSVRRRRFRRWMPLSSTE